MFNAILEDKSNLRKSTWGMDKSRRDNVAGKGDRRQNGCTKIQSPPLWGYGYVQTWGGQARSGVLGESAQFVYLQLNPEALQERNSTISQGAR